VSGLKPKDLLMIPARVALALQADGWWLRSDIIWAKPNPMPESVTDRPTSAHEHVFLLAKSARYYYDNDAVREPQSEATLERFAEGRAARKPANKQGGSARQCDTWRDPVGVLPDGRNLRNVWTIATAPFSEAHFATFPPALAEICIKAGTSERGQCPHCAAPWARVVERSATGRGETASELVDGLHSKSSARSLAEKRQAYRALGMEGPPPPATLGWQPTCACPAHTPVPQTVLDPFAGAGTTLLAADRLGRNGVGIELNPAYATMARNRLTDDCPLFAEVA
jgi:hypothetical protein